MIWEAEMLKRILFTSPSESIFWQLTGSGENIEDFLGRKLSELDSGTVYSVGNAETYSIAWTLWNRIVKKRHAKNILFALKMGYFYHRSWHSQVVIVKAVRNGYLFR